VAVTDVRLAVKHSRSMAEGALDGACTAGVRSPTAILLTVSDFVLPCSILLYLVVLLSIRFARCVRDPTTIRKQRRDCELCSIMRPLAVSV
jgi:hypothetical protein